MKRAYFISGIDTDCGKTYITGLLGYQLQKAGKKVITSKLIQTGCIGISDDIKEHRRIMEIDILPEDTAGLTCPYVFSFPASPHLSAELDGKTVDLEEINKASNQLLENYDILLMEGAGGLMVPLNTYYLTLDYIRDQMLPLILVCSSKLGSINQTLMSIEMCKKYSVYIHGIIYNRLPDTHPIIAEDSFQYIQKYLNETMPEVPLIHSDSLGKNIEITNFVDQL
ncbi:MAG: ATP-dependent dethiobiotin synthetase BioD [Paludibacteraceae bacterium]|nr:ATP-dependent dethiobiotin synthetase BioD [Paludibacteraceae bacterium]MBN2788024.1 ATP-dependent dethiobiotin synthetase BioD [Paludibacteraceae bacterium]